jgi:hypothetical protein
LLCCVEKGQYDPQRKKERREIDMTLPGVGAKPEMGLDSFEILFYFN